FHSGPFLINKGYYEKLIALRQQFIDFTHTRKQVFLTFITNYGIVPNSYSKEIVDAEIDLEQLMEAVV
ncbi:MAG: ATPase, partial [Lewinella sp.]|nr:ATPase [Lewinella sp.]